MEVVSRICLFIAGMINFFPCLLVFMPDKIRSSYGIEVPDVNYELLLRHRAVLFGIIGGVMIYSSIVRKHYTLSTVIGIISMVSFLMLFLMLGEGVNQQLGNVMRIDFAGIIILLIGYILHKKTSNNI